MLAACLRASSALNHRTGVSRVAGLCQTTPNLFTTDDLAAEAAQVCQRCPLATACLLDALAIDAAYRRGEDPWGLSGVCGGVAFDPSHKPRRIPAAPTAAPTPGPTPGSTAQGQHDTEPAPECSPAEPGAPAHHHRDASRSRHQSRDSQQSHQHHEGDGNRGAGSEVRSWAA